MRRDIYDPTKPFNEQIRQLIQTTHPQDGPCIVEPHGKRFLRVMDHNYWKDFHSQDATDGIGTKGYLHWLMDTLEYGVQDAFAMVVDDQIETGFITVHLQDHILMQEENEERIFRSVGKLQDLCVENLWEANGKSYPIAITGGETAILNTVQGFEMGITATGYVRKGEEITPAVREDDVLIGLGSGGLHSNGYSFIREEFFDKRHMKLDDMFPWGVTVGKELTRPTHVYMPALKELTRQLREYIHGMVHVTGGGLSKLRELMPAGDVDIEISRSHPLKPQEIFQYAFESGVPSEKMYTRFNNGVGYVIAIEREHAPEALAILRRHFPAEIIGEVNRGNGKVVIESQYEDNTVVYK